MYGHNRREIEEAFNMRDHFELENHRLSVIIDDLTMEMNLIKYDKFNYYLEKKLMN